MDEAFIFKKVKLEQIAEIYDTFYQLSSEF